jgi:hypothetical protein
MGACPAGGDALELALKQVEQQYGKGSIMRLGRCAASVPQRRMNRL